MAQSLTLLPNTDPRFAPVANWDRSLRLMWVIVIATLPGGPYSVYGEYPSLRRAMKHARQVVGPAFVSILQVTLGNVYLHSGGKGGL